ncbi:MAG: hypothetical protein RSE27_03775, partial [Ruthenibacterium sp.]
MPLHAEQREFFGFFLVCRLCNNYRSGGAIKTISVLRSKWNRTVTSDARKKHGVAIRIRAVWRVLQKQKDAAKAPIACTP